MRQWLSLIQPFCEFGNFHSPGVMKIPFNFWELPIDLKKICAANDDIFEYQYQISSLPFAPHSHYFQLTENEETKDIESQSELSKFQEALLNERKSIENNLFPGVFVRYFQDREVRTYRSLVYFSCLLVVFVLIAL